MTSDRYDLVRPLSEGGAGRVWLAEDRHDGGRRVALKRLHAGVDAAILTREFDMLRRLSHPNIASVLDYGTDDDGTFVSESFVDGPDLLSACAGRPLAERGRLLAQVLRGLEYLHARGLVHGDVKPDNVLVAGTAGDRVARLIDFGLAAPSGELATGVAGTLAYLAPERIREQPPTPQSDLYAFGITAYEVVTGRRPFSGDLHVVLRAQMEAPPRPPSEHVPGLPPTLDRAILRLLEKSPADRPASAREALTELCAALGLELEAETAETLKGYLRSGRLVGRAANLARARALIGELRRPTEGLHLLWWHGPRGSGRTRLLREISGEAKIDGARVATARGGDGGPLGPVRAWLRGLGVGRDPLQGALDRWHAVDRAVTELLAAATTPTLLVLDDADAADELTSDSVRVLLARLAEAYVPGAAPPPPLALLVAGTAPPERLRTTVGVHHEVQSLSPLSPGELGAWLKSLVPTDRELPRAFVDGLHRLTSGLPGHVVTLLGALAERGDLRVRDGALEADPEALSAPLPDSLADALADRERSLPDSARGALDVLRALCEPAPARLVALVAGTSDVDAALSALVDRGLVGADDSSGEVRYRAEGAGAAMSLERRRELHARIAQSLLTLSGRDVVSGFGMATVARHAREAVSLGDARMAGATWRSALAGADEARTLHAGADEAQLLGWALGLAPEPEAGRAVALRLGDLLRRLGRFDASAATYDRVQGDAGASPDERDAATLGLAAIDHDRGDYPRCLERASSITAGPRRPEALAEAARALLMTGRYDEALEACTHGLDRRPGLDTVARLRGTQALVYYYTERSAEALPAFEASAEASRACGDVVGQATAVNGIGLVHHRKGDFGLARDAYEESLRLADLSGNRKRVAIAAMNIGTVLHETGHLAGAVERYRESLRAAELLGDEAGVAKAANNLGNLLITLNRRAEARYWIDRSTAAAERQDARLVLAYNQGLSGKLHHAEGELDLARHELTAAVAALREMGNAGEAGELIIELGLIARTAKDVEGVDHFAAAAATQAEASGADKQRAWVAYLRGEARRLAGDSQAALGPLRTALALADKQSLPDLGWMAEAALARSYRELGNALEARARFHAASERVTKQAGALSGRDKDDFLAEPERARALDEARLVMGETGALPAAQRESHERFLRIMEINRRLVSEHDLQRLLEFILDSAIALTGAERGFVLLASQGAEKGQFEVRIARNIDQESLKKNRSKMSQSIARDVIESGEPVVTVDAAGDERFREALSVHHLKLRSILCFPLKAHGEVIGAIYLDNRFQTSTFTDHDVEVIAAFADQAAVAITNAWLHEQRELAKADLQASNARIEALNAELLARVDTQAARIEEIEANLTLQRSQLETRYRYDNIIGTSPALRRIFAVLDRVTDTGVPVLIQGESGTGKELVARAIHYNGPRRRDKPFVSVNCAALTETLLESELFGHTKGAFTGADRDRKGLFEVAHGGTLFLDEVADMSLAMQAKLLRALQEGEIWPVGARKAIQVDVRVVTACNRDLQVMVAQKEFRQDLFFRLNVVRIVLPPLREREEDLVLLVQHFLRQFSERYGAPPKKLSQSALDLLLRYPWPGNIRELESCISNACLFCDGDTLAPGHFSHKPELVKDAVKRGGAPESQSPDLADVGTLTLAELEERAILAALERAEGNKVEAARRLGVTRQTLYNKLKSLGIEVRRSVRRLDV